MSKQSSLSGERKSLRKVVAVAWAHEPTFDVGVDRDCRDILIVRSYPEPRQTLGDKLEIHAVLQLWSVIMNEIVAHDDSHTLYVGTRLAYAAEHSSRGRP